MQDEVNEKIIMLSVKTGKLTAEVLQKSLKYLLSHWKNKTAELPHGKQTLRQLMKHNAGVSNIEITDGNIKAFEHTAKKYRLSFSLKKDRSVHPPRYLVFFKGNDIDVMTAAFREFSAKKLSRETKPSIRQMLVSLKKSVSQGHEIHKKNKDKELTI